MNEPYGWGYQDSVRRRYRALKHALRLHGRRRLRGLRRATRHKTGGDHER